MSADLIDIKTEELKKQPAAVRQHEYALAMASYIEGECRVIIWIHSKAGSRKIEYRAKPSEDLCTVYVPRTEFEKDFKYCLLSGISVASTKRPFRAQFGGGPAGDRDIYWFEWGNAQDVHPNFYCFIK